jgi:acyl carrier protein
VTGADPILVAIQALVERVSGPRRIPAETGPETHLSEGGFWLDSVELLEVVVACEERFGIVFDAAQDLTPEALETLATLTELVRSKCPRVPFEA